MSHRRFAALCIGLLAVIPIHASAVEPAPPAPGAVLAQLLVVSPHRITEELGHRKLRFVLKRADGRPPVVVATGEQSFQRVGDTVVVTICRDCGDEPTTSSEQARPYLQANAWVQSRDPLVTKFAARAGAPGASVDARMKKLTRIVEHRLRGVVNDLAYDDAAKALRQRHGDCTEFALALAALARAQGIPARVVFGMAYSSRFTGRKHVFAPHVWVQAWDAGRWRSYDGALAGFDSTHVAMAIGSGDPAEARAVFAQLPRLRIERVGVVAR